MKKYLFLAIALLLLGNVALAMPSYIAPTVQTSTATTSPVYMTPGTATSTLTYDTYTQGNNYIADKAVLLTQFTGSSTSAILGIDLEYSLDGIDWYQDELSSQATTTRTQNLQPKNSFTWTFASTTLGGVAGSATISTKALLIQTPMRFVRVVYTITGANGGVWGQIVPIKQKII